MSNFRNPRFGLLPGAPRGANPVAPPLQDPNGLTGDGKVFASSTTLEDGQPHLLAKLEYPTPRACNVAVCAPLIGFANPALPFLAIQGAMANKELWILGKCVVGLGGTSFSYEFDMPAGQTVMLSHCAQYLEVSARLIQIPKGDGITNDFRTDFLAPPIFMGRAVQGVRVLAQGGNGYGSMSNATRRARCVGFSVAAGQFTCSPPPFANVVQVTAKSNALLTWGVETDPSPFTAVALGPMPMPAPCCELPVPEGSVSLQVAAQGADVLSAELVWRLGFSGMQA